MVDSTTGRYRSTARGDRLDPHRGHPRRWQLTLLRERLAGALEVLGDGGGTVLDYGCGNRSYEPLLRQAFERYVGVDLPGNPEADVAVAANGALPLADGRVDCVLTTQVLEHVERPQLYLRECRRVLRPGGALILSTHGIWPYHPDPTDYWRWTPDGLERELERAGFEVVETWSVFGLASVAVQLWQDATAPALPGPLRSAYVRGLQSLIGLIERKRDGGRSPNAAIFVLAARAVAMTGG